MLVLFAHTYTIIRNLKRLDHLAFLQSLFFYLGYGQCPRVIGIGFNGKGFLGCAGTVWKFLYRSHGNPRVLLKEIGGAPERYDGIGFWGCAGTVWNGKVFGLGAQRYATA